MVTGGIRGAGFADQDPGTQGVEGGTITLGAGRIASAFLPPSSVQVPISNSKKRTQSLSAAGGEQCKQGSREPSLHPVHHMLPEGAASGHCVQRVLFPPSLELIKPRSRHTGSCTTLRNAGRCWKLLEMTCGILSRLGLSWVWPLEC